MSAMDEFLERYAPKPPQKRGRLELVGVAELAEELGITKQAASQKLGSPGFPEPLARLKAGPVWDKRDIVAYRREREERARRERLARETLRQARKRDNARRRKAA